MLKLVSKTKFAGTPATLSTTGHVIVACVAVSIQVYNLPAARHLV